MAHTRTTTGLEAVAVHCPSCSTALGKGKVLQGKGGAQLTHYTCKACMHHCVSLVFRTQVGLSSVVLVTDLSFDDVRKMKNNESISSDEVLGLHQLLKNDHAALVLVADPS